MSRNLPLKYQKGHVRIKDDGLDIFYSSLLILILFYIYFIFWNLGLRVSMMLYVTSQTVTLHDSVSHIGHISHNHMIYRIS